MEILVAIGVTLRRVFAANRLALKKGRSALAWRWAAALLGPFPLIPLALLPKLFVDQDFSL
jgi:hypothetical protein